MPGGLAGPLGTAAVMASSLAQCRLTAGKVSWATGALSAPCLYCDMLCGAICAMDLLKHGVSAEKTSPVARCIVLYRTGRKLLPLDRASLAQTSSENTKCLLQL